ncbi:diphosphoinositol polyphosphate phosphohydrolase 2-like isoform X4 [Oncorhynchus keta]|uniref:diphosphoinositol polyphosphate phosphohydrolase 2-like isoform X4 n=1 Tax=Oncorhynchus keta TaxID=8018 RepID=UPI0015F80654|nr:diphosphoinositol polyphosphate phosphohydrolase 2-like isoform X4 [Oncorhynchus keta]
MHSTFRISLEHEGCEYMMKFKPNQTRIYDGEGFKRRAACLCFKNEKEDEVLLVSSSRHPDQWIVPGGGMEPEEEPCGAAVREVYEEDHVTRAMGSSPGMLPVVVRLPKQSEARPNCCALQSWGSSLETGQTMNRELTCNPLHGQF